MKTPFVLAVAAGLLLAGCSKSGTSTPSAQNANANAASNSAAATPGYLGTLVKDEKDSEKKIDVSYLNQAIQLYNAQEGHNPKTLQDLVPNYVGKLPQAPYGYKLNYDAAKGEVTVVKE